MNTDILIMAGGIGSRFWPESRENFPEELIDILGVESSLLKLTADRFNLEYLQENIYILRNATYTTHNFSL